MSKAQNFRLGSRGRVFILVTSLLLLLLSLGSYALFTRVTGNFHEVVKGSIYRSGQLNCVELAEKTSKLGIRSVLNLRGRNLGKDWYDEEVAFCVRNGIRHEDIQLSSGRELSLKQMNEIVVILKTLPAPLLIHCKDGADRTALVAALYHLAIEEKSPLEADKELTMWYGHIPFITPHVAAMDRSFWSYATMGKNHEQ
jgi:protein tyrosine/serine phosphatase